MFISSYRPSTDRTDYIDNSASLGTNNGLGLERRLGEADKERWLVEY